MKKASPYIITLILCVLMTKSYTQCPSGASWLTTPVNGALTASARIQVLDTVDVSSTNPTAGSFATARPGYSISSTNWGGYPYENLFVYRGGGAFASTTFKLKMPVDSGIMHFKISDVRGDGFNAETQRILGYNNGVLVSATANDAINGATFTGGNTISGGGSTTSTTQSSIRIFFNGPVDSVVVRGIAFNDYIVIELAARCDVLLPSEDKIELTAKTFSTGILLQWKIEGEIDALEIERSEDKNTWTLLTGTAGNLSQFLDVNPLQGTNYYRIKTIESTGKVRYSNAIRIKNKSEKNVIVLIYPNPFKNAIYCSSGEKIISYQLASTTGHVILSKKINAVNSFTEQLPSSLSQELYYLTLYFQNGERRCYKLFKGQ